MTNIEYNGRFYNLGAMPSELDSRDIAVSDTMIMARKSSLPTKVDHRPDLSEIKDQGQSGSCVAFSLAKMKEFQETEEDKLRKWFDPIFIYVHRTLYSGRTVAGMTMRNAFKIIQKIGAIPEQMFEYPIDMKKESWKLDYYDHRDFQEDYSNAALYTVAKNYRIKGYASIRTLIELKSALARRNICPIVLPCYNSNVEFWKGGGTLGYHCVWACGYNDEKEHIIVGNQWGKDWADEGYTYLPYDEWGVQTDAFVCVDLESELIDKTKRPKIKTILK